MQTFILQYICDLSLSSLQTSGETYESQRDLPPPPPPPPLPITFSRDVNIDQSLVKFKASLTFSRVINEARERQRWYV